MQKCLRICRTFLYKNGVNCVVMILGLICYKNFIQYMHGSYQSEVCKTKYHTIVI